MMLNNTWGFVCCFIVLIGKFEFAIGSVEGGVECHRQYETTYKALYGDCNAFNVLTACVQAEMPTNDIEVRGAMQAQLDAKQPAVCDAEETNNCTGLVIRPELCESVTISSSSRIEGHQIAAIVLAPMALLLITVLVVRNFGSHRMPRIDPAKALHAMNVGIISSGPPSSNGVTNGANEPMMDPPMGLPKIMDDNLMDEEPLLTDTQEDAINGDHYGNIDKIAMESGKMEEEEDDDDNDDDEDEEASDDEEI